MHKRRVRSTVSLEETCKEALLVSVVLPWATEVTWTWRCWWVGSTKVSPIFFLFILIYTEDRIAKQYACVVVVWPALCTHGTVQ